jgi:hypothetical protein
MSVLVLTAAVHLMDKDEIGGTKQVLLTMLQAPGGANALRYSGSLRPISIFPTRRRSHAIAKKETNETARVLYNIISKKFDC